ncbi:MAG: DNA cytosine methyltransferase [Burkholderiales bacterium]|nr:DNA cytosine methyltransferase [Burkholderiales bacterium]
MNKHKIKVVDLFCGIGGLTNGLQQAGLNVVAGFDFDKSCKFAYEENNSALFFHKDVSSLSSIEVNKHFKNSEVKILVGCAPCQPFSSYNYKQNSLEENKWKLLYEFARLIQEINPDIVSMENVPQLLNFKKAPVFQDFVTNLQELGYYVSYKLVFAPDYGVPQKRKRLILLASKFDNIGIISSTHTRDNYVTVRNAIGMLPHLEHGGVDSIDFVHKASKLSDLNIQRLKLSKPGSSWKYDWSEDLLLKCHRIDSGKTYGSVYGRMKWDDQSPTMTTFCTGIGNGRFGHPEQNRAISLREAAILQSFPMDYKFAESKETLKHSTVAKQIGNAVPPALGKVIGLSIIEHLSRLGK